MEQDTKKAYFHQKFEMRNGENKTKVRNIFLNSARDILRSGSFGYSERICDEVATDIIDKGAKLMANSAVDDDDDDREMNALNNLGDSFLSLQTSTCLFLKVDDRDHKMDEDKVRAIIPMPTMQRYNLKREEAVSLQECLPKLKDFIEFTAARSFSATIVVYGEISEDGVVFGSGATIPQEVLLRQASKMMNESTETCPLALDVVFMGKDDKLNVVSLPKSMTGDYNPDFMTVGP